MTIAAILLFGSLARKDHTEGSDTDILVINLGEETRHISVGHLSLFSYPWKKLELDSRRGDLFVCHLVREARVIIDPDEYLSRLRELFEFRLTYEEDIRFATDLGWYLVRFGDELNPLLQLKRALWCIRTILIARSVELREPVFAPERLAEKTDSPSARDLLIHRRQRHDSAILRASLREFLEHETPLRWSLEQADREVFIKRFVETSNKVALQTLSQKEGRAAYFK